ncbi:hypothetical protein AGR4A_Cc260017 [Agrobacterium tumefaciens str. B6]|uniref:Uncharacterized protein n=1 Tax=Agrobacterium tumefaciens str. B6 TaxID=1183423 RepID=A0A822V205_AGRTU|nr:hypothetical protein AGR4A_Cc260017 [Agrobacterium tumefaciens str. B6]
MGWRGSYAGVLWRCVAMSFSPHCCACHRNSVDARLRGGESFQPKDLGWLDSCDRHSNEERKSQQKTRRFQRVF